MAYIFFSHALKMSVMTGTIIAWIVAVLFAYVTNRKYVFHSDKMTRMGILRELFSFFVCRFSTGVVDWILMFIFVDCLNFYDVVIKMFANAIVIVLNYVASRLVIFKKNK